MAKDVNLEIMEFVEQQILPRYNAFGKSHGLIHAQRVIKNSLDLVPVTGADCNMVYVIAAYHDLGMGRATGHSSSNKWEDTIERCTVEEVVLTRTNPHNERSC